VQIANLVEIISAAHLSYYVDSPFEERGGIMLVGPPASLKTAVVEVTNCYPNANIVSDLTIKQASRLREDLCSGRIITMVFSDFAKLYQRQSTTASNMEGFIRAITAEGYRVTNWEDSRMQMLPARSLVIGCMTTSFYTQHFSNWKDDGFSRRFLWSFFRLHNPDAIIEAIIRGVKLEFTTDKGFNPRIPTSNTIPWKCTSEESRMLSNLLRYQEAKQIGISMLQKMLSALKWKFPGQKNKPMEIIKDFSESLGKDGTKLYV
jgi:hypothetical protein